MPFTIQSNDLAAVPATQSVWYDTDLAILAAGFSGTGVVSGCAVSAQGSPDMTVAVAAGTILAAGVQVAVSGGNLTVGSADATNPRIDLITTSAGGVKTVTAGTAAISPKPPALPSGHIGLAFVDVPATDTTISTGQITDKRVVLAAFPASGYATVATDQTTTSATATDLATSGPAVTITVNTKVKVTISADMYGTAADTVMNMLVALSGANTVAVNEAQKLQAPYVTATGTAFQASRVFYLSGLTPGSTVFTAKYYRGGTGTAHFRYREILVELLD